ncbi:MAG: histidinol dehydrogenase [Methanotrichaceae archaeon]
MIFKKLSELSDEELSGLLVRDVNIQDVIPRVVEILSGVEEEGDKALARYTEELDGVRVGVLKVSEKEIEAAYENVSQDIQKALEAAADNIMAFHYKQLEKDLWMTEVSPGVMVGQKIVPLESIGAYVPGGRAVYPSTALMTVIPAKVAGVPRVIVCTPPRKDGSIEPITLVAADMAGADEIYKLGGVQAIAAMAFGTDSIPDVEKIVGPGNVYVTAAKQLLRNTVEIDMPAGPSEVLIISDYTGKPDILAADLIAQAEHDPHSVSVLVVTDEDLAIATRQEVEAQAKKADRKDIVMQSLENSAILIAATMEDAIVFSNTFAPEHLEIIARDAMTIFGKINNAGSVFLGRYTPVAAGDYASGTNHVLPTSGYARVLSGLNADHFVKKITVQQITREGLAQLEDCITTLAEAEGLKGHAESVRKRLADK